MAEDWVSVWEVRQEQKSCFFLLMYLLVDWIWFFIDFSCDWRQTNLLNVNANGRDESKCEYTSTSTHLGVCCHCHLSKLNERSQVLTSGTLIPAYYCCQYNLLSTCLQDNLISSSIHNGNFLTKLMRKFAVDAVNAVTTWSDLTWFISRRKKTLQNSTK